MKFKFLQDIPQLQHYKGELVDFDPKTDKMSGDTFSMCIGHGALISLKIGVDVEQVPLDAAQEKALYFTARYAEVAFLHDDDREKLCAIILEAIEWGHCSRGVFARRVLK